MWGKKIFKSEGLKLLFSLVQIGCINNNRFLSRK